MLVEFFALPSACSLVVTGDIPVRI
eukprot:SAG11_NODE_32582_length_282_cov_1.120219_1_plen_24_part_10